MSTPLVAGAAALVRQRLYIIGTPDLLAATLARHSSRPRTQLVDMLARNAPVQPPALLLRQTPATQPAMTPPFVTLVLGTTDATVATNEPVTVASLQTHLDAFLTIDDGHIDLFAEEEETRPPPIRPFAGMIAGALAPLDYRHVDTILERRLRALEHVHPLEHVTLSDDERARRRDCWHTYTLDAAYEDEVVAMLCIIVRGVAEEWYVEAERRLFRDRCTRLQMAPAHIIRSALAHSMAILKYLPTVQPPASPEDMEYIDAFNLFTKLHAIRTYVDQHE